MWNSAFAYESERYERELDEEAARLVRRGYSPMAALRKAGEIVRRNRQHVNHDKDSAIQELLKRTGDRA